MSYFFQKIRKIGIFALIFGMLWQSSALNHVLDLGIAKADSANITQINFTTPERTVDQYATSAVLTTQTQNIDGNSESVSEITTLNLESNSPTGEFSRNGSTWYSTPRLENMSSGTANMNFYYRDSDPGTHTITISDQAGLWTPATQNITIIDIPPVVTGVADGMTYNTDRTINYDEGTATLNGNPFDQSTDNPISAEGVYQLSVTDAGGTTTVNFAIDKTAPVISITGDAVMNVEYGSIYTELGATWTDNFDGTGDAIVGGDAVNTNVLGATYTVAYNYTDQAGNPADEKTRTVNVVDTTKPEITVTGDEVMDVEYQTHYTELGATWIDNFDGTGDAIVGGDTVNTNALGTYIVTYNYTDTNGNVGDEKTRTVNVVDTTAPIVTGVENGMYYNDNRTITFNEGYASLNGTPFANGDEVTAEGTYQLVVIDPSGNMTTVNFVIDKTAPEVTINSKKTNHTQPSLSGTINEATLVLEITVDGQVYTATNHNDGTWTIDENVISVLPEGIYDVVVFARDLAGNESTDTTTDELVIDTSSPSVDAGGNKFTNSMIMLDATVDASISGVQSYLWTQQDGTGTVFFTSPNAEDTNVFATEDGVYTIRLTVLDQAGNTGHDEMTLTWDTVAPTADVTYDPSTLTNTDVVATLGNYSENITITNNGGSNTYTFTGNDTFTFEFVDDAGNVGSTTATVTWIDKEAPEIAITGDVDMDIEYGSVYDELGATWTDNVDGAGDVTDIGGDTVDTNVLGTYVVTYNYTDQAGTPATQKTRTVNVVDTTKPVITVVGDDPQVIEFGSVYTELGATAEDNYDGDITGNIDIDASDVDVTTLGTYQVVYTVTDSSGNTTTETRTVNVVDTTKPIIETFQINNGNKVTNNRNVILKIDAQDASGATKMRISHQSNFAGSSWQDYAQSTTYSLPDTDGKYTLYIQVKDISENVSETKQSQIYYYKNVENIGSTELTKDQPSNIIIIDNLSISATSDTSTTLVYANYGKTNPTDFNHSFKLFGTYFDLSTFDDFNSMVLTIIYTQDDLDNADITNDQVQGLYYFDVNTNEWKLYENQTIDRANMTITVTISHLTLLALGAKTDSPSNPQNFKAQSIDGTVKLTWEKVDDAKEYQIRYKKSSDNDKHYSDIFTTIENEYEFTDLEKGVQYIFQVRSVDYYGNISEWNTIYYTIQLATQEQSVSRPRVAYYGPISYYEPQEQGEQDVQDEEDSQELEEIVQDQDIKGEDDITGETESARSAVTLGIIIIAIGAALGGYYGYQWWLGEGEVEEEIIEETKPKQNTKKQTKSGKKKKSQRRW
jgi:hypothetical protein